MAAPVEGPNGQMVKALDLSQLPKRRATAEEKQMLEEAGRGMDPQRKAEVTKTHLTRQIQTVFRVNGTFAGYVSEDAITRLDGQARFVSDAELDRIRSDYSLTSEQIADRLSQRMSEKMKAKFGDSVEIQHFAPGEGPTVADIRAEVNDDYQTGTQVLRAELNELDLSPQAFAEVFGEK
jgi:hypothetical protein